MLLADRSDQRSFWIEDRVVVATALAALMPGENFETRLNRLASFEATPQPGAT